jgi:hypothetical protein
MQDRIFWVILSKSWKERAESVDCCEARYRDPLAEERLHTILEIQIQGKRTWETAFGIQNKKTYRGQGQSQSIVGRAKDL